MIRRLYHLSRWFRSAIAARYAPLIDVLYSRQKECNLSIAVSSEGGGSGQMEIRIEIIEVADDQ